MLLLSPPRRRQRRVAPVAPAPAVGLAPAPAIGLAPDIGRIGLGPGLGPAIAPAAAFAASAFAFGPSGRPLGFGA